MSDNLSPIKSVIISGNLNDSITYKLCPSTEFSEGVWNLSLFSVAYVCNVNDVNLICSIACNLVKAQKYNLNNEVESYEQPLAVFSIESAKSLKVYTFEKTWFYINALSNELKITITNERNHENLQINCDLYVQLLFQRVK